MCSRPRTVRRTSPAPSSTRMCFDVELSEIGNARATSVTRASDSDRRARMARRVGSATAEKTRSSVAPLYSPIGVNIADEVQERNPHRLVTRTVGMQAPGPEVVSSSSTGSPARHRLSRRLDDAAGVVAKEGATRCVDTRFRSAARLQ